MVLVKEIYLFSVNKNLGCYLAGLIEGGGNIIVSKKKKLIRIKFNKKDKPLLDYLLNKLLIGKKVIPKKDNDIFWEIFEEEDLIKLIDMINGKFRTPKLEALHK